MFTVLGHLSNFVEIYLDDITIHSKNYEDHLNHIETVAACLKEANLKIKPSKCKWICTEISLLGHIVSGGTVRMDPKKIDAIQLRTPPKNMKQVQQYLGICNYYRRFIQDYAKMAKPMFNLLKTDKEFKWDDEAQISFDNLKKALVSYPILRQPDWERPFQLFTDASGFALGAVLSQRCPKTNQEYACAYASRLLKGAEMHYGITEKECLAVVWAIRQFRVYLLGSHSFEVITDHSALAWLINIKDPTGRLARWAVYLQAYEFTIVHRKGIIHCNADTLSRPPIEVNAVTRAQTRAITAPLASLPETREESETSSKSLDILEDESAMHFIKIKVI